MQFAKVQFYGIEKAMLDIVLSHILTYVQHFVGLARTCEIFGVSELVLSNVKVLEEKQFQSLSVTAEKWLTIKEVQYC